MNRVRWSVWLRILAGLVVLGLVWHFWYVVLAVAVLVGVASVVAGRRRRRRAWEAEMIARADESLRIAHEHGLQALLEQRPRSVA